MNKRRRIYKGFNKRRRSKYIKHVIVVVCVGIVSTFTFIKIKESDFMSSGIATMYTDIKDKVKDTFRIGQEDEVESSTYEYEDVKDELEESNKESEEMKLANIEEFTIWTIQVASVKEDKDIEKIQKQLDDNKLPSSIVEIEGSKKIQTYSSFDQEDVRQYLDEVKNVYPDAFITSLEIPMISLEYTQTYSYVESITENMNLIIDNFKEESKFWIENKENVSQDKYISILEDREKLVSKLSQEVSKVDYEEMSLFKENLLKYCEDSIDNIHKSKDNIKKNQYNESKSLYLSCIHGYLDFINSMQKI